MIETLNALNDEYRFLTLCLDEDGDVCGSYDFILYGEGEAAAQHAKGMVFLVANVMDQCMPDIMKVVWGRQDEEEEEEEIREDLFGTQEEDEGE